MTPSIHDICGLAFLKKTKLLWELDFLKKLSVNLVILRAVAFRFSLHTVKTLSTSLKCVAWHQTNAKESHLKVFVFVYLSNTEDRFQRSHSLKLKKTLNYAKTTFIIVGFLNAMFLGGWWTIIGNWENEEWIFHILSNIAMVTKRAVCHQLSGQGNSKFPITKIKFVI